MLAENNYKTIQDALKAQPQSQANQPFRPVTWNDVHRSTEPAWRSSYRDNEEKWDSGRKPNPPPPPPKDNPSSDDFGEDTRQTWEEFFKDFDHSSKKAYERYEAKKNWEQRQQKERQAQSWSKAYERYEAKKNWEQRQQKERQAQSWSWSGERSGNKGYKKVYKQACRDCSICNITRLTTDTDDPYICYECKKRV